MTTITTSHDVEDDDDGTTFLGIADMDDWAEFWAANGDEIGADEESALRLAQNCALIVGGGAAPLFRVGFVD